MATIIQNCAKNEQLPSYDQPSVLPLFGSMGNPSDSCTLATRKVCLINQQYQYDGQCTSALAASVPNGNKPQIIMDLEIILIEENIYIHPKVLNQKLRGLQFKVAQNNVSELTDLKLVDVGHSRSSFNEQREDGYFLVEGFEWENEGNVFLPFSSTQDSTLTIENWTGTLEIKSFILENTGIQIIKPFVVDIAAANEANCKYSP